jgi:hypothetical protein
MDIKNPKEITDLTMQKIQITLDELWDNEHIKRIDFINFLQELVDVCQKEIEEFKVIS